MKLFQQLFKLFRRPARTGHFEVVQHFEQPYIGNPHFNYASRVKRLDAMYRGTAEWGCAIAKTVIDTRSTFTIGAGVNLVMRQPGAERELEFIKDFLKVNGLDRDRMQSWAAEAEIEGKFLAVLCPEPGRRIVSITHWPWIQGAYTVLASTEDYQRYVAVEYDHDGLVRRITHDKFLFRRFGGRSHDVNDTPSRVSLVVNQMENFDRAIADLRKKAHVFASPTPHFKTQDPDQARDIVDGLRQANWKAGRYFVGTADFKMVESKGTESESLVREAGMILRAVSAGTGLPPQFLGHPEMVSGNDGPEMLADYVLAATARDRAKWIDFYTSLFRRVFDLANESWQAGFNRDAIGCTIPSATSSKLREVMGVWLPVYMERGITLKTLLSKIPEMDVESELKALKQGGRA